MAKTLTVYLAADVSRLTRGLDQGKSALAGLERSVTGLVGAYLGIEGARKFIDFLGDAASAAIQEEQELTRLNTTLANLGFAQASESVNKFVDDLQFATGVADSQLRPAFDRIIRSTQDVAEAQKVLSIALDVSKGTGKDLQTVADALSKAYDGNTTALGRLGLGIDKTTLAAGSLDSIMNQVSGLFQGQAAAATKTLGGQIDILKVAADELKESFGKGLVGGLASSTKETGALAKELRNLQPQAEGLGLVVGKTATGGLVFFSEALKGLTDPGGVLYVFGKLIGVDTAAVQGLDQALKDFRATAGGPLVDIGGGPIQSVDKLGKSLAALDHEAMNAALESKALAEYQKWVEDQSIKTAGASGVLTDALKDQSDVIRGTITDLKSQTSELEVATQAVLDYRDNLAGNILKDVNLGQAAETGKETGQSLLEAFNAQVNQAKYFGNVLTAIKAQGADQSLIEQIASLGPLAGSALGQQLLDEGLVPQINASWVDVQKTVSDLALGLVPDFLLAGQESAISLVNGTVEQLGKEEKRLRQIGKNIGKPIGANIKAEIAAAVAEAVSAAEAAKTAAAAERASNIAAQQVVVTEQQVAQALNRLIVNSNARTGYQTAPATSPVFG